MKLPLLLQSLRPEELRDFEKFLHSPFFKDSEQYQKFFRFLRKHHPGFELDKADLEAAYRRCFGAEALNETKRNNLQWGLSKQLEQFLVVQEALHTEGHLYDQLLVKALGKRNLGPYFRKEAQQLLDRVNTRSAREADDYLTAQQLYHCIYYNPDTPRLVEPPAYLSLAAEHLDLYYCVSKLRYVAEMKARERLINVRYDLPLLEAVLEHCAATGLPDKHPLVAVYYHLVQLYLQEINEPGFRALKTLLLDRFSELPKTDQPLLLRHLINCGIWLIARDAAVEAELLALYQAAIDTGVLLDGNRITHFAFINIANLASLCGQFAWGERFIEQFAPYLEEEKRQPAVHLAKAGLYYKQGRLDEAQAYLASDLFTVYSFDLLARGLLVKIFFDRFVHSGQDYDFLLGQLKSFERWVRSKALPQEKKDAQLNWVKFVRRMAVLKFDLLKVPGSKKATLHQQLNRLKPSVYKKWLAEKIDSL